MSSEEANTTSVRSPTFTQVPIPLVRATKIPLKFPSSTPQSIFCLLASRDEAVNWRLWKERCTAPVAMAPCAAFCTEIKVSGSRS